MFGPGVDAWVTGVISASTKDEGRYAAAFKPGDVMRQAQQALYEMSDSLTGIEDLVTRLIHATRDPEYTPSRRDRRRTGQAYKLHPDGPVVRENIRETCENFYIVQKQRAAQLHEHNKLPEKIRRTQARPKGPITTGGKDGPNEVIRALLSPAMIRKVRAFADSVGIGAGSTKAQKDAMMEDTQFASLRRIASLRSFAEAQRRQRQGPSFGNTDAYGNPIPDVDDDENSTEATGGHGAGSVGDAWKPPPMLYTEDAAAAPSGYNNGAAPQYPQQFPQQIPQFPQQQFPQQQFQQQNQFPQQQFPQQQFQQHQFPPQQFQQQNQFPQQQYQQQQPYAQGQGYYDQCQGQYNGGPGQGQGQGQGPLTFTQKVTKLINDVMGSQIGQFVCAAVATLVVYLIVCAFLRWLDNGTWIFCRLYDNIVGFILGPTWEHKISNEQRVAIAVEAFKKTALFKELGSNGTAAATALKNALTSKSVTFDVTDTTKMIYPVKEGAAEGAATHGSFFQEFWAKNDAGAQTYPASMDDALKVNSSLVDTAKILAENDAIKFVGLPSGLQSFAEDTSAMVLLYTSLVSSTFLGFVGARKRFFVIPAGSFAASIWLRGSRTSDNAATTPDTAIFKSARDQLRGFTKDLQPTEVAILIMGLQAALGFVGMVVAGGSASEAARKASFTMTHGLQGELERRQASRRMHDESVARLSAHPAATMLKTGAEFLGFNNLLGY